SHQAIGTATAAQSNVRARSALRLTNAPSAQRRECGVRAHGERMAVEERNRIADRIKGALPLHLGAMHPLIQLRVRDGGAKLTTDRRQHALIVLTESVHEFRDE